MSRLSVQRIPQAARLPFFLLFALLVSAPGRADELLVEAESFEKHGGWKLDTQFIDTMGSPYLLAHGLGAPIEDATTTVTFPSTGTYRVFVRTKDWVAPWKAPGQPGRFRLQVDGKTLPETFGTKSAEWFWQEGGKVEVKKKRTPLALEDLTGFDGRCDAVYFTSDPDRKPPEKLEELTAWRKKVLGLPEEPKDEGPYHLVVIGGGYSGMGAALSAARMGLKVALIQNRPVLGGNGSSEVRVWANGLVRRGRFPRVGEIIDEFADQAKLSPGTYEEFGDAKKEALVRAEKNIDLFLDHHASKVEKGEEGIAAVIAFHTRSSLQRRFVAPLFVDCTGHGTIGFLAGADFDMTPKGRMGMSNMWRWETKEEPQSFPETEWALDLEMEDFPYPGRGHGQWFWEGGFDKDPIGEAELIRDWNLRAVFGAFGAMKNRGGAADHGNAVLTWVAYVGGPRESRRLLGDVILNKEDVVSKRDFPDGCVPSTWSIDLHYPKKQYLKKYPDNPFISVAEFDRRVDRDFGYPVPYRCFYSRNVANLFMAGRCISVTHEALGTVRVMKTCGMMGEVVGKAASVCIRNDCMPRDVYDRYMEDLKELLQLPGKARRESPWSPLEVPKDVPAAHPLGPPSGVDPAKLEGIVIDDRQATKTGAWTEGTGLAGYIGHNYLYASGGSNASIRFEFQVKTTGKYEVRLAYRPHENRSASVPVEVHSAEGTKTTVVNMQVKPPLEHGFISLGQFEFQEGKTSAVVISAREVRGHVHADAVQIIPGE